MVLQRRLTESKRQDKAQTENKEKAILRREKNINYEQRQGIMEQTFDFWKLGNRGR